MHTLSRVASHFREWRVIFASGESLLRVASHFCEWRVTFASGESFLRVASHFCEWRVTFASGESLLRVASDAVILAYSQCHSPLAKVYAYSRLAQSANSTRRSTFGTTVVLFEGKSMT